MRVQTTLPFCTQEQFYQQYVIMEIILPHAQLLGLCDNMQIIPLGRIFRDQPVFELLKIFETHLGRINGYRNVLQVKMTDPLVQIAEIMRRKVQIGNEHSHHIDAVFLTGS